MIALFQLWYFSAEKNQRINDSYALMCWYLENSFVIHILCALYFDWFMSSFFFHHFILLLEDRNSFTKWWCKKYLWPLAYTYISGLLVYKINIYLPNLKSRYHDNDIAFFEVESTKHIWLLWCVGWKSCLINRSFLKLRTPVSI